MIIEKRLSIRRTKCKIKHKFKHWIFSSYQRRKINIPGIRRDISEERRLGILPQQQHELPEINARKSPLPDQQGSLFSAEKVFSLAHNPAVESSSNHTFHKNSALSV